MILTKVVQYKAWAKTYAWLVSMGYRCVIGDLVTVRIEDVPSKSDKKVERKCELCKTIDRLPYSQALKRPNYCQHCSATKIHIGVNNSNFKKEAHPKCVDCGKELSRSKKYKRCKKCFGIKTSGDNHYRWLSDRSKMVKRNGNMQRWSNSVKVRDYYTCNVCGITDILNKDGILVSHHLTAVSTNPDKMYITDNGICLCTICHKEFHTRHGYGSNTKKQFNIFFKRKSYIRRTK